MPPRRRSGNTKKKEDETEAVQTEEKGKASSFLSDKSSAELDEIEREIKAKRLQNHLENEKARIKALNCPKCGNNLELDPNEYMKKGNPPHTVECKDCERLIHVTIRYKDNPENSEAILRVKSLGYPWQNQAPSTWTDEHVEKWLADEKPRFEDNKSQLPEENQKIFRVQLYILKKLKVLK